MRLKTHLTLPGGRVLTALLVLLLLAAAVAGCGDQPPTDVTPTAAIALPTLAPLPTEEPILSPTSVPTDTRTPLPTATARPTPTSFPVISVAPGETIRTGSLEMVVQVLPLPNLDAKTGPAAGQQFVALTVVMTNTGRAGVAIAPSAQMLLKDSSNQIYKFSARAVAAVKGTIPEATLAPGETIRAQIAYEIPAAATGLQFTYTADRFGGGKVFVKLP